jgi:type II secretory pathway component PulF
MPYLKETRNLDDSPARSSEFKLPNIHPTASDGDLLLLTFVSNLSSPRAVVGAWMDCEAQCSRSRMKSVANSVAQEIEGGMSMSEAMTRHDKVFGAIAIGFIELAEHGLGMKASLQKYFELQERRETNSHKALPRGISPHTLDFALVAGVLMKCGAAVTDAFSIAASDRPKKFKAEVARVVKAIQGGDEIADAFNPENGKGIFRFKFDERFRKVLGSAEATGKSQQLAEALEIFGGYNWAVHQL